MTDQSHRAGKRKGPRNQVQLNETHIYDPVPGTPPSFLADGCTCEKATVRASSSGPVIFSARSIHTWVE